VPALLLASLLYILASLGIGLFISTISRTQQEAFMSMFLILLPALILSGFLYPIHTMPQFFQLLTLLNPVRYFLEIVRAMFLKGSGVAELWPQYLIIAFMAVAVLRLATWRFQRTVT
jgi:ABC-2 type transport system permease protein